jgi:hypothetical protein
MHVNPSIRFHADTVAQVMFVSDPVLTLALAQHEALFPRELEPLMEAMMVHKLIELMPIVDDEAFTTILRLMISTAVSSERGPAFSALFVAAGPTLDALPEKPGPAKLTELLNACASIACRVPVDVGINPEWVTKRVMQVAGLVHEALKGPATVHAVEKLLTSF